MTDKNKVLEPAFTKNNIAVFCSTDDNYLGYCSVLIQSIVENANSQFNYDIIILKEKLNDISEKKLLNIQQKHSNISIRTHDVSDLIEKTQYHLCAHFTKATYYRLYAPSIFKNYKKIVYLDIDTLVLTDISKLYEENCDNYLIAATLDYGVIAKIQSGRYESLDYFIKELNIKDPITNYFQAGVLVFNLEKMRQEKTEEQLLQTARDNNFAYVDQDVLNKVCYKKCKIIDSSWNTPTLAGTRTDIMHLLPKTMYEKYVEDRRNPNIIHYCSYEKPWKNPSSDLAEYFWHYARKTPFYEEILYRNLKVAEESIIKKNEALIRDIANYSKDKIKYYRYKLLSLIMIGKKRKKYKQKRKTIKAKLKQIKYFLKHI